MYTKFGYDPRQCGGGGLTFSSQFLIRLMSDQPGQRSKDPLQGKTLEAILTELFNHFGWEGLARQISVNCFKVDPSINSSLKFLRKTPWARTKLEKIYISFIQGK